MTTTNILYYRHKLYYATLALKPGSRAVITDVCVPISRLPDILLETRKDIDATGIIGWLLFNILFDIIFQSIFNVFTEYLSQIFIISFNFPILNLRTLFRTRW